MELHPITVHFTVGLFFAGFAFELLGWILRRDGLRVAGWWNLLAAGLAAVSSVLTGRAAEAGHPHTDAIHAVMEVHEQRGYIFLGLVILVVLLRALLAGGPPFSRRGGRASATAFLVPLAVAAIVLFSGAGLGGRLVYDHGMGVSPVMDSIGAEAGPHDDESHDRGSGLLGIRESEVGKSDTGAEPTGHDHSSHDHSHR